MWSTEVNWAGSFRWWRAARSSATESSRSSPAAPRGAGPSRASDPTEGTILLWNPPPPPANIINPLFMTTDPRLLHLLEGPLWLGSFSGFIEIYFASSSSLLSKLILQVLNTIWLIFLRILPADSPEFSRLEKRNRRSSVRGSFIQQKIKRGFYFRIIDFWDSCGIL